MGFAGAPLKTQRRKIEKPLRQLTTRVSDIERELRSRDILNSGIMYEIIQTHWEKAEKAAKREIELKEQALDKRIIIHKAQGTNELEIAIMLSIPLSRVSSILSQFEPVSLPLEKTKKSRVYKRSFSHDRQVVKLSHLEISVRHMAALLGLSENRIIGIKERLRREGRIAPPRPKQKKPLTSVFL